MSFHEDRSFLTASIPKRSTSPLKAELPFTDAGLTPSELWEGNVDRHDLADFKFLEFLLLGSWHLKKVLAETKMQNEKVCGLFRDGC